MLNARADRQLQLRCEGYHQLRFHKLTEAVADGGRVRGKCAYRIRVPELVQRTVVDTKSYAAVAGEVFALEAALESRGAFDELVGVRQVGHAGAVA